MSDIDSKPTTAEERIAKNAREALANAKANGRLDRLVQATLASAAAAIPAQPPRPTQAARPVFGGRLPLAVGTAALAGVVALAWTTTQNVSSEPSAPASPATANVAAAPLDAARDLTPPPSPAAATPPGVSVTSLPDAVDAKRAAGSTPSTMREPPSSARALDVTTAAANVPRERGEDASALFERANAARRGGDHVAAEKLYTRLVESHPDSREAMTSRVILGRVLLSRGAAAEALASFDAYLAGVPRGTLAEQALIGRAQSLQALGRRADERAAWRALLEAFPHTASRQTALERGGDSP